MYNAIVLMPLFLFGVMALSGCAEDQEKTMNNNESVREKQANSDSKELKPYQKIRAGIDVQLKGTFVSLGYDHGISQHGNETFQQAKKRGSDFICSGNYYTKNGLKYSEMEISSPLEHGFLKTDFVFSNIKAALNPKTDTLHLVTSSIRPLTVIFILLKKEGQKEKRIVLKTIMLPIGKHDMNVDLPKELKSAVDDENSIRNEKHKEKEKVSGKAPG